MYQVLEHIECIIVDSVESLESFMEMVLQGERQENPDSTLEDTHQKFEQLSHELSLDGTANFDVIGFHYH